MTARGYVIYWDDEHFEDMDITMPEGVVWGRDGIGVWVEIDFDPYTAEESN